METLISNAERRSIANNDNIIVPRVTDLAYVISGVTGKVELVFEGEEEGITKVAKALVAKAVKTIFKKYFPDPNVRPKKSDGVQIKTEYDEILEWFAKGNSLELTDTMPFETYAKELARVPRLKEFTARHILIPEADRFSLSSAMEFVLDGLHQHSKLAKEEVFGAPQISYRDMVGSIFTGGFEEEEEEEL
jgi:magnesium chelatase subunit I